MIGVGRSTDTYIYIYDNNKCTDPFELNYIPRAGHIVWDCRNRTTRRLDASGRPCCAACTTPLQPDPENTSR